MYIPKISKTVKDDIISTLKRKELYYINTLSPVFSYVNSKGETIMPIF